MPMEIEITSSYRGLELWRFQRKDPKRLIRRFYAYAYFILNFLAMREHKSNKTKEKTI